VRNSETTNLGWAQLKTLDNNFFESILQKNFYCSETEQYEKMNPTKRELVLLVEDDPDDELLALRSFQKGQMDADIVVVRDGIEALDYLFGTGAHAGRDLRVMPTRIILDLSLPKLSGLEVLQRIKADVRTRNIPVAMLTGSNYPVLTLETLRQGAEACFTKPFTPDGLRQFAGL
jgi:two-component system response regulator